MTPTPPDQPPPRDLLLPGEDTATTRRSFLQAFGFGIAASTLAACSRGPRKELLTWAAAQPGVVANRAYHVATACLQCPAGCGLLARCKDGRPLKLEGLPGHPVGQGALCAQGQAGILELYDSHRFDAPLERGKASTFAAADAAIQAALAAAARDGGRVRLLTGTVHSPSTRAWIRTFLARFPGSRHCVYDALSASAILDAHAATHGVRALPRYRFDRADVVAAFDADFLGTWISPVEFAAGWAAARRPGTGPWSASQPAARMSRHWQFEARVSLTGGRADMRRRLAPWELGPALMALRTMVEDRARGGRRMVEAPQGAALAQLADELWAARGRALVVCGPNEIGAQSQVNHINQLLEAYGHTLDLERPSLQRMGRDGDVAALREELQGGLVDVLVVAGVNPAYDFAGEGELGPALAKARMLVCLASVPDETAALATWVLPEPHALEAWHDTEPITGCFGLLQPTVPPLKAGRTLRETLARWCGDIRPDRELLQEVWQREIHPRLADGGPFARFFRRAQREGFVDNSSTGTAPAFRASGISAPAMARPPGAGQLGLLLYPKVAIQDGRHAHNAWLQELADPVSRLAWESYAVLSPAAAERLGIAEGDVVQLRVPDGPVLELPAHLQPGQHDDVVAVALGYGRLGTERFAGIGPEWYDKQPTVRPGERLGVSVGPLVRTAGGHPSLSAHTVSVTRTGARVELATTQEWQSLRVPAHLAPADGKVRDAVRNTTLTQWLTDPTSAIERPHVPAARLWPEDHKTDGPGWGMAIDLSACTGCSSCVIACQAENNVPVVGRDEVRRHREMAWLRIDRYHDGDGDELTVAHQPMMCQHCGNAPCESVCPVLATVHSEDGLNQQVYNRCVGTRYCANTCPYKVRRFNWFDYPHQDELENHALNPDVTVRSRGVMEKCSLCVQRIQDARLEARRRGVPLADGDIQTACQQTCPTRAITFGDTADPRSRVSQLARSARGYQVLEELNVEPVVRYLAIVRNPPGNS